MEELEQILLQHIRRYPEMQPQDIVKLIYQNEFGGGHLITDEQKCLDHLRREYAGVAKKAHLPAAEAIGNGIYRIHLGAISPDKLEQLGRDFIASAREHSGTQADFFRKLELLKSLSGSACFPFSVDALLTYLQQYLASGCPRVSHSDGYRRAYAPAYRVITAAHVDLYL